MVLSQALLILTFILIRFCKTIVCLFANTHFLLRTQVTIMVTGTYIQGVTIWWRFSYKLIVEIKYELEYNLHLCLELIFSPFTISRAVCPVTLVTFNQLSLLSHYVQCIRCYTDEEVHETLVAKLRLSFVYTIMVWAKLRSR